jgi:hypothetical protein
LCGVKRARRSAAVARASTSASDNSCFSFAMTTPETPHQSYYALIGLIASDWAVLEAVIDLTLWDLVGGEEKNVACLTAQYIGLFSRINALMALVRLQGGSKKLLEDIEKFQKDVRGINEQRNRAVHDPIKVGENGQLERIVITAQKALKFETVPLEYAKLVDTVSLIKQFIGRFANLRERIIRETRDTLDRENKAFLEKYLQEPL